MRGHWVFQTYILTHTWFGRISYHPILWHYHTSLMSYSEIFENADPDMVKKNAYCVEHYIIISCYKKTVFSISSELATKVINSLMLNNILQKKSLVMLPKLFLFAGLWVQKFNDKENVMWPIGWRKWERTWHMRGINASRWNGVEDGWQERRRWERRGKRGETMGLRKVKRKGNGEKAD